MPGPEFVNSGVVASRALFSGRVHRAEGIAGVGGDIVRAVYSGAVLLLRALGIARVGGGAIGATDYGSARMLRPGFCIAVIMPESTRSLKRLRR